MKILTNDPSITGWGWAVIHLAGGRSRILESGCIKTESQAGKRNIYKADDRARRITIICKSLVDLIKKHDINWIVTEAPHGSQNYNAAVMIGMVPGILCGIGACFDLPVEWYSEGDAKKYLSGKRSLTKAKTIELITEVYGNQWLHKYKYQNEAVADALAVFHIARHNSQALIYASNQ